MLNGGIYMKKEEKKILDILETSRDFLKIGDFQTEAFRVHLKKQFENINFGNYTKSACKIRNVLLNSATSKNRAINTVDLLLDILKPFVK